MQPKQPSFRSSKLFPLTPPPAPQPRCALGLATPHFSPDPPQKPTPGAPASLKGVEASFQRMQCSQIKRICMGDQHKTSNPS